MTRSPRRHGTKPPRGRQRGAYLKGWDPHFSIRPRCEWLEARLLLAAVGPYVTEITPTQVINAAFDHVDLTFNESIDPATFSTAALSITGPSGAVTASSVTELAANSFRVSFPALTLRGDYQLTVGPNIADLSGHLMDQNQDGTAGNAATDAFKASLIYANADVIFSSATTINGTNATYDGRDILIEGTTVTINGPHNFDSVQLIDGSVLSSSQYAALQVQVAGILSVDSTSRIDVSGLGFYSGGYFQGGSYGGLAGHNGTGNAVYGDYANPDQLGSGGSDDYHGATPGGGLVRLTTSTLALDGQILADGGSSSSYGGSGGGVYIAAETITGSGGIHADGGSGPGSGGGGGRVAVYAADFTSFSTSAVTAYGGGKNGGAGTVYLRDTNQPLGDLVIDAGITTGGVTPLGLPGQTDVVIPDSVVIRGGLTQVRPEHAGMTFEFTQPLTVETGATLTADGTLITDAVLTVDSSALLLDTGVLTAKSPVMVKAATLKGGTISAASLAVTNGGVLSSGQYAALQIQVAGILSVDSTSRIDVSSQGYQSGGYFQGGSYGGLAGHNGTGNAVYGDYANPDQLGSGGSDDYHSATPGGGLVRLTVGTLALDGQLMADGGSSSSYGGSGGGVYIVAATVTGSGGIHADGGSGPFSGGGGGRVAVYAADFFGFNLSAVTAFGGGNGGAGTVYLRDTNEPSGTLIIDAGTGGSGVTPIGLPGQTNVVIPDAVMIRGASTHVQPEHAGMTFQFQQPVTVMNGARFTASVVQFQAPVVVNAGAPVALGAVTLNGSAAIIGQPGSAISVTGSLLGNTQDSSLYKSQGSVSLGGSGTALAPQLFEVMSQDLGAVSAGFQNNFAYGSLSIGGSDYVRFVDQARNSTGSSAEAVYADSLIVSAGTTLDLSGLHLYARVAQVNGDVVNGSVQVLPAGGGPIALATPTPGTIHTSGARDEWTFFDRATRLVTMIVDAGSGGPFSAIAPVLGWAEAQLLDSAGNILADAKSPTSGGVVTLNNVVLPADGVYRIHVFAAGGHASSTGNYVVAVWDVTPNVRALDLNQTATGALTTPYSLDQWIFSAAADQQIRFDLVKASSAGLDFDLTGPSGTTAFHGLTASSNLLTLAASGQYTLSVYSTSGTAAAYALRIDETTRYELPLGNTYSGTLAGTGEPLLFHVQVPVAQSLLVKLFDQTASDSNELYVSFGEPPTRESYEYRSGSEQVLVPKAAAGDWYILLYAASAAPGSDFTLQASGSAVELTGISPSFVGNGAPVTLTVTGSGFDSTTTLALVGYENIIGGVPTPVVYPVSNVEIDSFTQITATLPPLFVPPGSYDVRIIKGGVDAADLFGAFHVQYGGAPFLVTHVIVPNPIGFHISSTIYVKYINAGSAAMPAPVLTLTATMDGIPGALMTLDPTKVVSGYWTSATPEGYSQSVQILASGSTPGVLQPGESETVPVYYAGWLLNLWDFNRPPINFTLGVLAANNTTPVDWPSLESDLQPSTMSTAAWNAVFPALTAQMGTTWGDYVARLDTDASYFSRLGDNVTDLSKLWQFEVAKADGMTALPQLASSTDVSVVAPGLFLDFTRVFDEPITSRYTRGIMGYGWSTPWETSLSDASDGTVTVNTGTGGIRTFQPDRRYAGQYFSEAGDHAVLTYVPGGDYLLREVSGYLTAYRPDGRLDYVQDTNGNRITAGYTGSKLTSLTHSAGQTLTLAYNAAGLLASVTSSDGRQVLYFYDSNNQLVAVQGFDGQTTAYSYLNGQGAATEHALASINFPAGNHQYFAYNALGQLISTGGEGGAGQLNYGYGVGGQLFLTDANNNQSEIDLNENGLVARTVDALGDVTTQNFDSALNMTQLVGPTGTSVSIGYNSVGEPVSITDGLHNTVQLAYAGPFNSLTSVTDARGNTTQYQRDQNANLLATVYANGTKQTAAFDPLGDALSFTNGRGKTIGYQRNAAGQVTLETFADGSQTSFTYNGDGTLATATDSTGTTTFQHDSGQRLTKVLYPDGRWLVFQYNANGQRSQMQDNTGFTVGYQYDPAGRLSKLVDGSGNLIVAYSYDLASNLARKDMGNGTYTTYQYDADNNLLHLINYAPDGTVNSRFDYTYNQLGQRVTEATINGTWAYSNDDDGQLVHAVFTSTNPAIANQDLQYVYDPAGNRVSTIINGVTTSYVTNNVNQYTSVGGIAQSYDADGNLTSDGNAQYSYNDRNQLVGIVTPTGTWSFEYDPLGDLIATVHNGQRVEKLVDPTGLSSVVATYSGSGSLLDHYTQGIGLVSEVPASGSAGYYDFDTLGSTAGITGSNGTYVNSYSYLPFGELLTSQESVTNPFQFVGQFGVVNDGSGLDLMRARYYVASDGRFASPDPIGVAGGPNLYKYVRNNPVVLVDPTGLLPSFDNFFKDIKSRTDGYNDVINGIDGNPSDIQKGIDRINDTDLNRLPKSSLEPLLPPLNLSPNELDELSVGDLWDLWKLLRIANPPGNPPIQPGGDGNSDSVNSQDPNALYGPAGYGPQDFVSDNGNIFAYRIDFENSATATAPAQQISISDPLDPSLNPTTFQLTSVGFGDTVIQIPAGIQNYQTAVAVTDNGENFEVDINAGLDLATDTVFVRFTSIVPGTQLPPSVLAGFLPAEDGTGRGMGFVSYIIQPKQNLATGTQIRNVALVTFDANPSIATDQVNDDDPTQGVDRTKQALVTIDSGAPTSSVTALPAVETASSFTVSWSGTDGAGGSGIASYNVYVSDDNGPFTLWQSATTQTSATYSGQHGHTYGFYSVATDNVANIQPAPAGAQATTRLGAIISAMHVTATAVENSPFSGAIATFTDTDLADTLTATITWDDGTTSPGTISGPDTSGVFTVAGTHTFAEETSNAAATVTISDAFGISATAASTVSVGDPAVAATALPITGTEGASATVNVATFTDHGGAEALADYAATIAWGDGNSSPGAINGPDVNGVFTVSGSNTYSDEGTYTATVTVTHDSAPPVSVSSIATVSDPAVSATPVAIVATEGSLATVNVATFTDPGGVEALDDYAANIAWGDGNTAPGTISGPDANGVFTVSGSNTYSEEGAYTATVKVTHDSAPAASTSVIAMVGDPAVSATPVAIAATEGALATVNVATFTDPGGAELLADYAATINWGDGNTSPGTISGPDAKGVFTVSGTNIYADEGAYTATVTIAHDAAPPAVAQSAANVGDAPPSVAANLAAASFVYGTTATESGTFSDYDDAVSVTASQGLVAQTGNAAGTWSWSQLGLPAGNYQVTVMAKNADGSQASASFSVTVLPAPLTITADDKAKVYGDPLPPLTSSYSGFVNGDTPASLTTTPTLSTTATAASHVAGNPYVITAAGAADPNYTISYVAGTLTVTPAPLTITADDKAKVYAAPVPVLTASYTGLVNGDTPASLTAPPNLSTSATDVSPIGSYPIDVSGAVDADYDITFVPGTLTIAQLLVMADPVYPGQSALFVGGTPGNDDIDLELDKGSQKQPAGLEVEIRSGKFHFDQLVTDAVGRIVVYGGPGDDRITVDDEITIPAWLFGGDGNDILKAGGGPSLLEGGNGDDLLIGRPARDVLIGGGGSDILLGMGGDDILIGGSTEFDANDAALAAIMAEWNSAASYEDRVGHLLGTLPGGLNGGYNLNASTVHDDGAPDLLVGGAGRDWYFANLTAAPAQRDYVAGLRKDEVLTEIA